MNLIIIIVIIIDIIFLIEYYKSDDIAFKLYYIITS